MGKRTKLILTIAISVVIVASGTIFALAKSGIIHIGIFASPTATYYSATVNIMQASRGSGVKVIASPKNTAGTYSGTIVGVTNSSGTQSVFDGTLAAGNYKFYISDRNCNSTIGDIPDSSYFNLSDAVCPAPPPPAGNFTVKGKVTDQITNNGVGGIVVTIGGSFTTSASDGAYSITSNLFGLNPTVASNYTIGFTDGQNPVRYQSVFKALDQENSSIANIPTGSPYTVNQPLQLIPGGTPSFTLGGLVYIKNSDGSAKPISGLNIQIIDQGGFPIASAISKASYITGTSNPNGAYVNYITSSIVNISSLDGLTLDIIDTTNTYKEIYTSINNGNIVYPAANAISPEQMNQIDDSVKTLGLLQVAAPIATVPVAPTIGTATAGNASATVAFTPTPAASNGGSTIISYTATSTPGNRTATGTTSPITVSGLINGISYSFTVHAKNSIGNSVESDDSNEVTPSAPIQTCNRVDPNFKTEVQAFVDAMMNIGPNETFRPDQVAIQQALDYLNQKNPHLAVALRGNFREIYQDNPQVVDKIKQYLREHAPDIAAQVASFVNIDLAGIQLKTPDLANSILNYLQDQFPGSKLVAEIVKEMRNPDFKITHLLAAIDPGAVNSMNDTINKLLSIKTIGLSKAEAAQITAYNVTGSAIPASVASRIFGNKIYSAIETASELLQQDLSAKVAMMIIRDPAKYKNIITKLQHVDVALEFLNRAIVVNNTNFHLLIQPQWNGHNVGGRINANVNMKIGSLFGSITAKYDTCSNGEDSINGKLGSNFVASMSLTGKNFSLTINKVDNYTNGSLSYSRTF